MITILDPAHGGSVISGKSTPLGKSLGGRQEKDANLTLARRLVQDLGNGTRLTREGDENHSIGERIAIARDARAGVFLSLHVHPLAGGGSTAWVHTSASPASLALAAAIQRELDGSPAAMVEIRRGELAALAPDRHASDTAACLVELEVATDDDVERSGRAIVRALRAHQMRYGRGGKVAVSLGNEELVFADTDAVMKYIDDRAGRFGSWRVGIDTTQLFPFCAICQLVGYDASGSIVTGGTGFYVAGDRLLTAGHVVIDSGSAIAFTRLEVRPGKNGTTQPFPVFSVTPDACFPHPRWFDKRAGSGGFDSDYDMAVIRVGTPPPGGAFFDYLDDSLTSVAAVAISGYGKVETTLDDWAANERQHLDIDTIRTVNDSINRAGYDAFTEGGTSGSPVFYVRSIDDAAAQVCRQEASVVGVHTQGYHASLARTENQLNSCCLITPEKKLWILQDWSAYGGRGVKGRVRSLALPAKGITGRPFAAAHGLHERYGRRAPIARAKEDDGQYFTDADQLNASLADTRKYDTRMVSTREAAYAAIDAFRAVGGGGAWTNLTRDAVADDLHSLVELPDRLQQGALNLCGPVAFAVMWVGRDPLAFVNFATTLYETGQSRIGGMQITPRQSVLGFDYPTFASQHSCPGAAGWMVVGSLRDDDNAILPYDPTSGLELLAGSTMPGTIASWMRSTGIWNVRDEADWTHLLPSRGIPHATGLYEYDGQDITLLINTNIMARARTLTPIAIEPGAPLSSTDEDRSFILNQFPNHFVILRNSPVGDVATREVCFRIWSWATLYDVRVPEQVFLDNYYGAVIGVLKNR